MSDRATLNVDRDAAAALRRVVLARYGSLQGHLHRCGTEAVLEYVARQEGAGGELNRAVWGHVRESMEKGDEEESK